MIETTQPLYAVIGGSGKTGSRVVERLLGRSLHVRSLSRSTTPQFDWEDESTWSLALSGASHVYVTYQPDLAAPGGVEAIDKLSRLCARTGVKHVVLLSGRGEPEAEQAEDALKRAGVPWTILRCSWFNQNFSENFLLGPILGGELALPVTTVAEPFIDANDIADVAVAVLTAEGHVGKLYELTGPELLRFDQAVDIIAQATEREIRYVPISAAEFRLGLEQAGMSPGEVGLIMYLFTSVLDGRNQSVTTDVQKVLGRPATRFKDYAAPVSEAEVWVA